MKDKDINEQFDDYQNSIRIRELHLRLLPHFDLDADKLLLLLEDIKESTILQPETNESIQDKKR